MIKKIFTLFLVFNLILVSSCVPTNKSTINNNNNNTFKTKADTTTPTPTEPVLQVKKDQSFLPTIVKKSKDIPISRSMQTTFPVNKKLEFQGLTFKPIERKTIFHKALTRQEMKVKRKEALKAFIALNKAKYKKLRQELRAKQKADLLLEKQNFKEMLKFFEKGSAEYNQLVQEQITEREKSIAENKIERKALNAQYKAELVEFRAMLNTILPTPTPKPNTFQTQAFGIDDCGVFQGFCDWWDASFGGKSGAKPPENTNYSYSTESDVANSYELQAPESNEVIADTQQEKKPEIGEVAIEATDLDKEIKLLNLPELPTCVSANIGFAQRRYDANRFLYIVDLSFSNPSSSCDQVNKVTITDQNIDPEYCNSNHIDKIEVNGVSSVEYLPSYENNRAGNYRMSVIFEMKNGKTYTETIEHQVLARGAEAFKNEIEVNYLEPLKPTADPFSSPDPNLVSSNNIGFHIKNTTGAYLDIILTTAKNEYTTIDKDKIFFGKCLSISEGDLLFDRKNLPTDDYVLFVKMSESDYFTVRIPFRVENTTIQASTFFLNDILGSNSNNVKIYTVPNFHLQYESSDLLSTSSGYPSRFSMDKIMNLSDCFVKNIFTDISKIDNLLVSKFYPVLNSMISLENSNFKEITSENCVISKDNSIGAIIDLSKIRDIPIGSILNFQLVLKNEKGEDVAWKDYSLETGTAYFISENFNKLNLSILPTIFNNNLISSFKGKFTAEIRHVTPSNKFISPNPKYINYISKATINLTSCTNSTDEKMILWEKFIQSASIVGIPIFAGVLTSIGLAVYYFPGPIIVTIVAIAMFLGLSRPSSDSSIKFGSQIDISKIESPPTSSTSSDYKPLVVCGNDDKYNTNCAETNKQVIEDKKIIETEIQNKILSNATINCTKEEHKKILEEIQKTSLINQDFNSNFSTFITNSNKLNVINKALTFNIDTTLSALKSSGFSIQSNQSKEENTMYGLKYIFDQRNDIFSKMVADFSSLDQSITKIETIIKNKGIIVDYPSIEQDHLTLINSLNDEFNTTKKSYLLYDSLKVFLKEISVFKKLSEKYTFKKDVSIADLNLLEKLKINIKDHETFINKNINLLDPFSNEEIKSMQGMINTFLIFSRNEIRRNSFLIKGADSAVIEKSLAEIEELSSKLAQVSASERASILLRIRVVLSEIGVISAALPIALFAINLDGIIGTCSEDLVKATIIEQKGYIYSNYSNMYLSYDSVLEKLKNNDSIFSPEERTSLLAKKAKVETLLNGAVKSTQDYLNYVKKYLDNPVGNQTDIKLILDKKFNNSFDDSKKVKTEADKVSNEIDILVKKSEGGCVPDDFTAKTNAEPSPRTIKCRINYISYQNERFPIEKSTLINNLKLTNEIRVQANLYEETNVVKGRTTGFALVTDKKTGEAKYFCGLSGLTDIGTKTAHCDEIASNKFSPRVYPITGMEKTQPFHAEIRIMEHIAKKYCTRSNNIVNTNNCREVTIQFFTDRKTCASCNKFLETTVNSVTPLFTVLFYPVSFNNKDGYLNGIYFEGVGELIPLFNY